MEVYNSIKLMKDHFPPRVRLQNQFVYHEVGISKGHRMKEYFMGFITWLYGSGTFITGDNTREGYFKGVSAISLWDRNFGYG